MYPTYIIRRTPQIPSQVSHLPRRCNPQLRHLTNPSFFGTPQAFFAPLARNPFRRQQDIFDHFDDFVNRSFEGFLPAQRKAPQVTYQPRFDVREVKGAYHLRGEVPGVETQDLEVEFRDGNVLVIRGHSESRAQSHTQPQSQSQPQSEAPEDVAMSGADTAVAAQAKESVQGKEVENDAASIRSEGSYVKPSVEDEVDAGRRESVGSDSDAPGVRTPTSETEDAALQAQSTQQAQQTEQTQINQQTNERPEQQSKYWLTERTTGSFTRTFQFPQRVDVDGVTAQLKNGILDVVVPKKVEEAKKISVL